MDTTPDRPPEETWDDIPEDIMALPTADIMTRIRLLDNDLKVCCNHCLWYIEWPNECVGIDHALGNATFAA